MLIRPLSKYHLKDLHREIDLFDRKIQHCQHYAKFECEEDRASALQKLIRSRQKAVKAVAAMGSQGMDFNPDLLPRSMKAETQTLASGNSMTRETSGIPAKTVLLVDDNSHSRAARARTLREVGMMVDCAATASAGLSRLHTGSYSLVLVDVSKDRAGAERLVAEIKSSNPRQLVAFLVGSPPFVVKSLHGVTPQSMQDVIPRRVVRQGAERASAGSTNLRSDFGQRIRQIQARKEEVA